MAKAKFTLILPNMASLVKQGLHKSNFPLSMQTLLTKARFYPDDTGFERGLFNHFSTQQQSQPDLPVAALIEEGINILCADPCYLHADRDHLLIFSGSLDISAGEADALIAAIQPLLMDFGANLTKLTSDKWIIRLQKMPPLTFTALPEIKGKSVHDYLPRGDKTTRLSWLKLWNEIQMLLFDLPLNEQRQQQGKLPINSLWFWGQGQLSLQINAWQSCIGNHNLLQQLARKTQVQHHKNIDAKKTDQNEGKHLIVMEPLDLEGDWPSQLEIIESYITEMGKKLKWNKVARLSLEIPNYGRFQISPMDYWKPW